MMPPMRPSPTTSGALPLLPFTPLLLLLLPACLSKPAPPSSCLDGSCLTVIAPSELGAGELVLDGGKAYWTIGSLAGSIRACNVDACAPETLADDQKAPHSMLVEGEDAIWATGSEMRRVNRIRAAPQPVIQIDNNAPHQVQVVRHPPRYLYWSVDDGFWRCDYDVTETCTSKSTLPSLLGYRGPLTLDRNEQLWVTGADGMGAYALATEKLQRTFPIGGVRTLVANETHVFAVQADATEVLALSVTAPSDTAPTRLLTGGAPRALALDGTALFVAEQAGRIVRIPILPDLGEPEEIAVGLPRIDAIALSLDRIYLIVDGRLIAYLPKL
jgi:hypothetical protein